MAGDAPSRQDRLNKSTNDQRSDFERDRDRVLYSSAFHRLAGITQIAHAGEESVFHTRQQHSIKVAQVGRRLAEALIRKMDRKSDPVLCLNPDVVETACLIHDLGHPPFGHAGETVLNEKVTPGDPDGFEGNAQSFRIITKLAVCKEDYLGMNLCRATLAASLKYPWMRGLKGTKAHTKWSAYRSEQKEFDFATEMGNKNVASIEATVMDWADDIAYSVHDLEDFHRCGIIPWEEIFARHGKVRIIERVSQKSEIESAAVEEAFDQLKGAIYDVFGETLREHYEGTRRQRRVLRNMTSNLIGIYINALDITKLDNVRTVEAQAGIAAQIAILKQITRDYIIATPSLAAQQVGYKKIVSDLYDVFFKESASGIPDFTPKRLVYLWDLMGSSKSRFASDCVASLSEAEAFALHARLTGQTSGSVLKPDRALASSSKRHHDLEASF